MVLYSSKFVQVCSGKTNVDCTALLNFDEYNLSGVAIWETNHWYQDLYLKGFHRPSRRDGGMRALIQRRPVSFFKDSNKNKKVDETGQIQSGIQGFNMHGVDYNPYSNIILEHIRK